MPQPSLQHPTAHAKDRLDFAVIGTQKAATSWLYYCLRDHPEVVVARNKDEGEYLGGPVATRHGLDWFFDRFPAPGPGQVVGDVSVNYLSDAAAVPALASAAPDLKVVALLRSPVTRAVSSYIWALRTCQVDEFDLDLGIRRALDLVESGREGEAPILAETLTRAYYGEQLRPYLDAFGPERVFVGLYEDVRAHPLRVLEGVYGFLGADPSFVPPSLDRPSKKTIYHPAIIRLDRLAMRSLNARRVIERVKMVAVRVLPSLPSPQLGEATAERLRAHFRDRVEAAQHEVDRIPEGQRPARPLAEAWGF